MPEDTLISFHWPRGWPVDCVGFGMVTDRHEYPLKTPAVIQSHMRGGWIRFKPRLFHNWCFSLAKFASSGRTNEHLASSRLIILNKIEIYN